MRRNLREPKVADEQSELSRRIQVVYWTEAGHRLVWYDCCTQRGRRSVRRQVMYEVSQRGGPWRDPGKEDVEVAAWEPRCACGDGRRDDKLILVPSTLVRLASRDATRA